MAQISLVLQQQSPTSVQLQHDEFPLAVDRPSSQGGGGAGLMGGQYMLVGIGGCFCSTLFAAAQSRDIEIKGLRVAVKAELTEEAPKRFAAVKLEVAYEYCSQPDSFGKLLEVAEKGCISVNTVKKGLDFQAGEVAYSAGWWNLFL